MDAGKNKNQENPNLNVGSGKFEIDAPDGWTKIDTTSMGLKTVILMSPLEGSDDDFRENINVVTEKSGIMGLKAYTELSKSNMTKMMTNYKERGSGSTTINSEPAQWVDYTHTMYNMEIDGRVYFIIKNKIAYVITTTARKGGQNKWQAEFDKAVNSFLLK